MASISYVVKSKWGDENRSIFPVVAGAVYGFGVRFPLPSRSHRLQLSVA